MIPELRKVTKLAAGTNHYLALTEKGAVLVWGSGERNQLARRIVERTRLGALTPREFGLPKGMIDIAAGAEHSFAMHQNGSVFAWGFNTCCQTGVDTDIGDELSVTASPVVVKSLEAAGRIIAMDGGSEHSICLNDQGEVYVWGKITHQALGIDPTTLKPNHVVHDEHGKPMLLTVPTKIADLDAIAVAASGDTSLAVSRDGRLWTWGYNDSGQTGANNGDEDVTLACVVADPVLAGKKVLWAGLGAHFCVVGAVTPPSSL